MGLELTLDPDDLREANETGRVTLRVSPERAVSLGNRLTRQGYRAGRWAEANDDRYVPVVAVAGCEPPVLADGVTVTEDDGEA